MDPCASAAADSTSSSVRVHRGNARERAARPAGLPPPTAVRSPSIRWSTGRVRPSLTCVGTPRPTA
eukprot:9206687-Alexandrium_andersonii.AAC.1